MAKASEAPEMTGAIERALRALKSVAEHGEFTPRDLAEDVGIPTSTAYRLLQSLGAMNFVEKSSHGSYRVGRELVRLSSIVAAQFDYGAIARPFLADLSDAFQETCAFALYLPNEHSCSIIETINALHPLQYVVETYKTRALVWGALGRAMLPWLDEADVRIAIERQGPPLEAGTPPMTYELLQTENERVRKQGCFVATSPSALGTNGTAAPVFNARGQIFGSLGVAIPAVRYDAEMQPSLSAAVIKAARGMSAALGHGGSRQRKSL
ncbi:MULTISPECIES: IclR family transcriptional regulator [unclassified Sphingobium]|uniref:IclR family transcriptional regulator n=1 Tax=unclassified Sphingobium TaxID=2611147 RepID=UPI002224F931|nr:MULTISPECIES: IclR family transcriptional regulator [unclassified Sphingobium]MCW2396456.1 DNA-binding IclR family transcriptional regulator [Sphingobium sp. B8D3B]MCW2419972.1 DNA-binding IclR family transcriptional regulator [Sphingobium sp. B8D3C]